MDYFEVIYPLLITVWLKPILRCLFPSHKWGGNEWMFLKLFIPPLIAGFR